MNVFSFRCVDCRSKNTTTTPPDDAMLYCWRCKRMTVQAFDRAIVQVPDGRQAHLIKMNRAERRARKT